MVHAAYTAKAADPGNDYRDGDPWWFEPPDDWNHDWPFPGPDPPGYEPEDPRYGCSITGDDEIVPSEVYIPSFKLHENHSGTTFRTQEPHSGTSSITWTATIDGVPLMMSIDGSDYGLEVITSYEHVGSGWYGDEPSITFDIDTDDAGSEIVLTATSSGEIGSKLNPDSFSVSTSKTIDIVSVSFIVTATYNSWDTYPGYPSVMSSSGKIWIHQSGASLWLEPYAAAYLQYSGSQYYPDEWSWIENSYASPLDGTIGLHMPTDDGGPEILGLSGAVNITKAEVVTADSDIIYDIDLNNSTVEDPSVYSISYELKVYKNNELLSTTTLLLDVNQAVGKTRHWVTVDGSDGTVTLVNVDR